MRAACVQLCSGTGEAANIAAADALIRAAAKDGAEFIATPENTTIMQISTKALFASITVEDNNTAIAHFRALAKELGIDLLIGSMAIKLSDTKAANRSYLFGAGGEIIARYDKMHMFDVTINETETWQESANYTAGQTPVTADIGAFKLGMSICYDLRFAALYKYYAAKGTHLITVPAAFTAITGKAHWEVLLRARAIETSAYVMAPAQGGTHQNGRATWGRSMIIDPWGEIIAHLDGDAPGYCIADLDMDKLTDIRARIPAWQQQTKL